MNRSGPQSADRESDSLESPATQLPLSVVHGRFVDRLAALVARRLDSRTRGKVDPEDVVQSAFRSFFSRRAAGSFQTDDWEELWAILAVIALRKCVNRNKHYHAKCRDVDREVMLGYDPAASHDVAPLSHDPTPSQAAMIGESLEQLLEQLNPKERLVLTLTLQGFSIDEVSGQVGRARRTVWRVLRDVRLQLEQLLLCEVPDNSEDEGENTHVGDDRSLSHLESFDAAGR